MIEINTPAELGRTDVCAARESVAAQTDARYKHAWFGRFSPRSEATRESAKCSERYRLSQGELSHRLLVIPRHPLGRVCSHLFVVSQQSNRVIERIDAVELGVLNQRHVHIANARAVVGFIKHSILTMANCYRSSENVEIGYGLGSQREEVSAMMDEVSYLVERKC